MPIIKYSHTEAIGPFKIDIYICTECLQEYGYEPDHVPDLEYCENCGLPITEVIINEK